MKTKHLEDLERLERLEGIRLVNKQTTLLDCSLAGSNFLLKNIMKAYEVNLSVPNSYKGRTRKVFVQANNINEIRSCENVLNAWRRKDLTPDECPCEIKQNSIIEKYE